LSYFLQKGTKTLSLSGISLPRGEVCLIVPTKERTDLLPKQVADLSDLVKRQVFLNSSNYSCQKWQSDQFNAKASGLF